MSAGREVLRFPPISSPPSMADSFSSWKSPQERPSASAEELSRATWSPVRESIQGQDGKTHGLSEITCFNCGKPGHKSFACPEPRKPGSIHEIEEEEQEQDFMDEDLGKEDP